MRRCASRDALTRLLNRNGLDELVMRHFAAREQLGQKRQVFFIGVGGWDMHDNMLADHTDHCGAGLGAGVVAQHFGLPAGRLQQTQQQAHGFPLPKMPFLTIWLCKAMFIALAQKAKRPLCN